MANLETNTIANGKLNVLYSYAYEKNVSLEKIAEYDDMVTTYLDSGAFTAYTQGKPVDIEEYMKYVGRAQEHLDNLVYFQLDVIGDPVGTSKNLKTMMNKGLKPIPIFTRGTSIKVLDKLAQGDHELISIGGVSFASGVREHTDGYVKYVMNRLPAKQKIHWLGYAKDSMLKAFNPYSFDSINWRWVSIWGRMPIWDGKKLTWYNRKDFQNYRDPKTKHAIRSLRKAMETILVNPCEFPDPAELCSGEDKYWSGKGGNRFNLAFQLSAISYLKYAYDVEQRLGSKYVFVYSHDTELEFLCDMFKKTKFYAKANN